MDVAMTIDVFKTFPPNREAPVAELNVRQDGFVDIPAEIYHKNNELRISLFGRDGGIAWEYTVKEWLKAIQKAIALLEAE